MVDANVEHSYSCPVAQVESKSEQVPTKKNMLQPANSGKSGQVGTNSSASEDRHSVAN